MKIDPITMLKTGDIVGQVLNNLATKPGGITPSTAQEMKPAIVDEISKVIVNQTNTEPWYQSTVTIGAIVTLVTGGYAFVYSIITQGPPAPADFATQMGPLLGAVMVIYGRWFQRKPIGA